MIVHCAAERRPDVAEQDPERAEKLNRDVVAVMAELAQELECLLIYVSTDYVFDGKKWVVSGIQACGPSFADLCRCSPPYKPEDKPNPLNLYGKLKEAGERAVLSSKQERTRGAGAIVLRVPLL